MKEIVETTLRFQKELKKQILPLLNNEVCTTCGFGKTTKENITNQTSKKTEEAS